MSLLLILITIKFFLNCGVIDVLFQWLYLEKYYLLLVWATLSMFHVVANTNSLMRDGRLLSGWVTGLPFEVWWDAWGEAWPPEANPQSLRRQLSPPPPATAPPCNNLFQSLSPTLAVVSTEGGESGCRA